MADTHLKKSDFSCVVPRLHASCGRMPARLFADVPQTYSFLPRQCQEEVGRAAAVVSVSGISIFRPSHSELLLPRRQSAPRDTFRIPLRRPNTSVCQRPLNMAGQEASKRVKRSRKPPPTDRSVLLQRRTTIAALALWTGRGHRKDSATFTCHNDTRTSRLQLQM